MKWLLILAAVLPLQANPYFPILVGSVAESGAPAVFGNNLLTGLQAFYKSDEASGALIDASGNGRNMNMVGTIESMAGKIGTARYHDSADATDIFWVGDAAWNSFVGDFTITYWFRPGSALGNQDQYMICKADNVGTQSSFLMGIDWGVGPHPPSDYALVFYATPNGNFGNMAEIIKVISPVSLAGNTDWWFAAITRSGNTLTMYLALEDELTLSRSSTVTYSTPMFDSSTSFTVGDYTSSGVPNAAQDTEGGLDEIGIWNRGLSACELQNVFDYGAGRAFATFDSNPCTTSFNTNGLVAHWKMNETSGTRADSHGTSPLLNNGTVTSATGKLGNAADFELADSDYLSRVDTAALSMGPEVDFSFFAWVQMESKTANIMAIVSKSATSGAASNYEWAAYYENTADRLVFAVSNGTTTGSQAATSLGSPSTGVMYFLGCWHDAVNNTLNIQINNGPVDTVGFSAGSWDSTHPFQIGLAFGTVRYWDGLIDSVSLFKRVLSPGERTHIYNGGAGLDYPLN